MPAGGDHDAVGGPDLPLVDPLWWTPERAEKVLLGQGALTHALIGVGQDDWRWQPPELDAVAPPMADAMNRVDVLRRFAPYADGIGALLGLGAYLQRSITERRRVLAQRVPVEEPVTGMPAPEPSAAEPPSAERVQARQTALREVMERGRVRAAGKADPLAEAIEWRIEE